MPMTVGAATLIERRLVSDVCCGVQHELALPETATFITGHPLGGFSAWLPGAGTGADDSIRIYKSDSPVESDSRLRTRPGSA
jgi:hypothetical protein